MGRSSKGSKESARNANRPRGSKRAVWPDGAEESWKFQRPHRRHRSLGTANAGVGIADWHAAVWVVREAKGFWLPVGMNAGPTAAAAKRPARAGTSPTVGIAQPGPVVQAPNNKVVVRRPFAEQPQIEG